MADFSVKSTELQSQIEPSATLVQPITRQNEIAALQNIGQGIRQGASTLGAFFKSQKANDGAKSLSEFSIKLNDLADAFDQGAISAADFGMRRRALLKQNLANNPSLEEDYLKRYSTFREQNGLSAVDSSGVQAAKLRQDAVQGAVNNGFLSIGSVGNQEAEDRAIQDAAQFQISTRQLEEQSKRLSVESSKLELGSKLRQAKDQEAKQVVQDGLAKIGRDGLPYWRTQYENIKARARAATNELDRNKIITEGVAAMEQDYAQRAASISGDTLGIEQGKIDQILKPQQDLIDAYKKELTGQYDTETFNRYVDAAQARSKALAMEGLDEDTKRWIAVSEIAKSAPGAFNQQILSGVSQAFSKNARASQSGPEGTVGGKPYDPLPANDRETQDTKSYLGTLQQILQDHSAGKFSRATPEQQKQIESEIKDQISAIFKGVDVYSDATESAKEFQPVIDFFASPAVGEYLKGSGIDPALKQAASAVIQNGYASQVVPLMKEELDKMYARNIRDVDPANPEGILVRVGDIAEPTFENGKFGFKLREGAAPSDSMYGSQAARGAIQQMNNSSFVKVMNKMIAADANIRGDGDKQKSWDEVYGPNVFPAEQGDTGGEDAGVDQTQTGSVNGYVDPMVKAEGSKSKADFNLEDIDDEELVWELPKDEANLGSALSYASTRTSDDKVFNSVLSAGKGYTVIQQPDGSVVRRSGARNWRNNNPGNIEYGSFAKSQGAIGTDGRFAVFPTYEAGRQAKAALLFENKSYKDKSISQAIARYAPDFENDTSAYTNAVARAIGVPASTRLSSLSASQREIMLNAMERVEGFKPGREVAVNS